MLEWSPRAAERLIPLLDSNLHLLLVPPTPLNTTIPSIHTDIDTFSVYNACIYTRALSHPLHTESHLFPARGATRAPFLPLSTLPSLGLLLSTSDSEVFSL